MRSTNNSQRQKNPNQNSTSVNSTKQQNQNQNQNNQPMNPHHSQGIARSSVLIRSSIKDVDLQYPLSGSTVDENDGLWPPRTEEDIFARQDGVSHEVQGREWWRSDLRERGKDGKEMMKGNSGGIDDIDKKKSNDKKTRMQDEEQQNTMQETSDQQQLDPLQMVIRQEIQKQMTGDESPSEPAVPIQQSQHARPLTASKNPYFPEHTADLKDLLPPGSEAEKIQNLQSHLAIRDQLESRSNSKDFASAPNCLQIQVQAKAEKWNKLSRAIARYVVQKRPVTVEFISSMLGLVEENINERAKNSFKLLTLQFQRVIKAAMEDIDDEITTLGPNLSMESRFILQRNKLYCERLLQDVRPYVNSSLENIADAAVGTVLHLLLV